MFWYGAARANNSTTMLSEILSDLRFGARRLRRSPGFTLVAVAMLALGIGANAAIFSFIDALLIKTLPVTDPASLVVFGEGGAGGVGTGDMPQTDSFSYEQLLAFEQRDDIFSRVAASPTFISTVAVGDPGPDGSVDNAQGQLVSGEYFDMWGIAPFAGRWIGPQDNLPSSDGRVLVLSYSYWQRRLNAEPTILGQTLTLQDQPFQIVGIAPPSFQGHYLDQTADMWIPLVAQPTITQRASMLVPDPLQPQYTRYWLELLGRLAPGVTLQQAEQLVNGEILRVQRAAGGSEPSNYHLPLTPAGQGISALRRSLGQPLILLYGAAALLLLIVCANLANLLLARASDRRGEIGVRLALGAGRVRLVRQLLAESALLAAAGAALELAVAAWLMPVIRGMVGQMRGPNQIDVALDSRVLLFAAFVSTATVLLFGLAPALWSLKHGRSVALGGPEGASIQSRSQSFMKGALVAGQAALSLFLLCCTGLLLQSLIELRSVDTGIATHNLYYFRLDTRTAQLQDHDAFRVAAIQQTAGIPGLESLSFIGSTPLSGNFASSTTEILGYEPAPDENMNLIYDHVTPGYFAALQIPLITGRLLTSTDRDDSVCVVSQAFAARFFPDDSPVGQTLRNREEELLIVGVVGDVRQINLRDDPRPMVYRASAGYEQPLTTLLFRTAGDSVSIGSRIREVLLAAAPGISVPRTPTLLTDFIDRGTRVESLLSELVAAFAGLALLLAALGVYGLFSYSVRQRSGEFGVRQALGANRSDVIRLVMQQAGLVLASGAAVGLVASLFATRILSGILYGVSPTDPWTFAISFAVLIAAGLIAAYAPARRAAAVNPADLLRHE